MSVAPSGPKDPRTPEFPEILTPSVIHRNVVTEQFNKGKAMPELPPPHNRVAEDGPLTREGVWFRRDHMNRLGQRPTRESILDRSFYSTDELLEEHLAEKQAEWDSKTLEYENWDEPGGFDGSTMWDTLVHARNKRWDKQSAYYARRDKIRKQIEKSELAAGTHHTQMSKKPRWVQWEEDARVAQKLYETRQKQRVKDDADLAKFIEDEIQIDKDVKNYERYRRWERAIINGEKWSDVMNELYPPWEEGDIYDPGRGRYGGYKGSRPATELPEDLQNMSDEEFSRMEASAMPRIREEIIAKKTATDRRIAQKWFSGEYYRDANGIRQSKENDKFQAKLQAKIVASRKANAVAIQKAKIAGYMNLLGGIEDLITTKLFGPAGSVVVKKAHRNAIKSIVGTAKAIDKKITSTQAKVTGAFVDAIVNKATAPARAERARIKALQDAMNKDLLRDLTERERNREDKIKSREARKGPSLVSNPQADALDNVNFIL